MIRNIVIIEDEKLNADRLKRLTSELQPEAKVLATLDSVYDSVQWFNENNQPDLILMDVRLSDGISFEIFDKVTITAPVIFTTAYDEYAVRAFKYNSVDYLLKPVEADELKAALEKFESLTECNQEPSIKALIDYLTPKDFRSRFLIPFRDGYKTVNVKDIAFFYSELKITRAKINNSTEEIIPQTLEELEQQLSPKDFFRVNRQFIVHIDTIQRVHNMFNGKLKLEIRNHPNLEIIVSRDKAQTLKNWLDY